ncbi:MAG: cupin domain-containing protein [Mycobacteriales bacterium]
MSLAYVAQAAEHQQLEWIGGASMSVLFDGAATDGQLAMMRTRMARGAAAPVHVHSNEDEMFVLLQGTGIFWAGDQRYEISDGGAVFLPRNVPHAYRFTSETVDALTLCTPAGIEGFFRAAGWDLSKPRPEGFTVTPAALNEAAAQFGQQILGPPPAEDDLVLRTPAAAPH